MKYIKIKRCYLLVLFMVIGTMTSCDDDFLDRQPLDAIGEESFFTSSNDLKNYMNGMYGELLRNVSRRWLTLEDGTDNLLSNAPHGSLMQHATSGQAPTSSSTWNGRYDYIRRANYLLENENKVPESEAKNHYVGEAYFARAWAYYDLLRAFGGVPYIDKVLNIDNEELYTTRSTRDVIASKIIEDLDKAIERLDWKGEGEAAAAQRINKQTALILKSRVALYEGSWEYYHGRNNTPFAVSGSNGSNFLQEAVSAGDMLITHEGSSIFKGPLGWEYFELFRQNNYSNIPGAYLYYSYDRGLSITQNYIDEIGRGGDSGLTKSAIDAYLMMDGKPSEISTLVLDELSLESYGVNKDPRLGQTIFTPDKGILSSYFTNGGADANILPMRFSGVRNQSQDRQVGSSGLKVWKGLSFDESEWRNGEIDDLIMRYAEGVLNYAEAKAILGTITQSDLDQTINVLRNRVGMPAMNLGEINGWGAIYDVKDGFDPSADNILNEIRRERRVELMLEGFRKNDIKRWALLGDMFNGRILLGAPAQELVDYWNDGSALIADGWSSDLVNNNSLTMTLGVNYGVDVTGNFINPFFLNSDFIMGGRGYLVSEDRDYLSGIPNNEIDFYRQMGVTLEQNPGWF